MTALLRVIKGWYIEVANKSDTDRKEVKTRLETKSADVKISAVKLHPMKGRKQEKLRIRKWRCK
jgi:hypothetical protein